MAVVGNPKYSPATAPKTTADLPSHDCDWRRTAGSLKWEFTGRPKHLNAQVTGRLVFNKNRFDRGRAVAGLRLARLRRMPSRGI